ncbi:MAG TPA: extracellular solute-binding protein [Firmicutes bacterium]|nr:extracellular solute-binding protein [Bacillota bacterium]
MSRRYHLSLVVGLLGLMLLVVAVPVVGSAETSKSHAGTTITVLSAPGPGIMPPVLEEFQKKTGIKVNYSEMAIPSLHSKLATLFAAGSSDVDVVWTYSAWTAEFGSAGYLEPLGDKISEDLKKDLIPGALEAVSYKGVLYGLPRFLSIRSFFYNKQMFREAGLNPDQPPKTWEEFKKAAIALTRDKNGDGKADQWGFLSEYGSPNNCVMAFEMPLYLNDGHMFDKDDSVLFNDARGVKALSELVELHKLGVVDPASMGIASGTDKVTRFVSGLVGMQFGWANTYAFANDPQKSKMVGQLGFGLIPRILDHTATVGGSEGYAIPKSSKKKEAALEFLEFVASKESQKGIAMRTGWMPVRYSVFEDREVQRALPLSKVVAEQAKYRADRFAAPYAQEVIDSLGPEILAAVKGIKSPKQALDDAAAKAKQIVAKYK